MDDTTEITQLLYRVYAYIDDHDFDGMGQLFTDEATGRTPGGLAEGREALIAQARRNHEQIPRLQHRVSNVLVNANGRTADIRAVVDGTFADHHGSRKYEIGEVYQARAQRSSTGWQLTEFAMRPIWQAGTRPVGGTLIES